MSLAGTVAMGTGVMIGAGIFALTGQVAEVAGPAFPLAFLLAAGISLVSAYSYIKVSNAYPSAGGIAMILQQAYGRSTIAAGSALLMALSMVINESLVARTFAAYALQLVDGGRDTVLVPVLAVALILAVFLVNLMGNRVIGAVSTLLAAVKVGGILVFAGAALWAADLTYAATGSATGATAGPAAAQTTPVGFMAGVALAILAYKGFTTITNSGAEVVRPERNVGRAILWSLAICLVVYMAVALAVGSSLTLPEIVRARDFSLAEAARPAFGDWGVRFTVLIAIVATASGLLASVFAVSRMLAMLSDMALIPHRHFGMTGPRQRHTLVYTVVLAALLAAFFDLGRIASLGAIYYLVMDMIIHWGVLRHLRRTVGARASVLVAALCLDAAALAAFVALKAATDPLIVIVSLGSMAAVFAFEAVFLARAARESTRDDGSAPPS
ncbi:APC family permease [Rhodothalassium salexigens]|uniref:APC family permease n=1 Tax=Rhodothalassium salexigens TaxID=1086 RepID=UPI003211BD27